MGVTTNININIAEKTSILEFAVDSEPLSEYSYDDGMVTLSEREAIGGDYADAKVANTLIWKWMDLITKEFKPALYPKGQFEYELKKREDGVSVKIKINDLVITEATWVQATDTISYEARPLTNFSWADFILWRDLSIKFLDTIGIFGEGIPE